MDRPAYSIYGWLSLTRPSFPSPLNSVGYRHVAALLQVFEIYTFPGRIIRGEHSGGSNNCIIRIYADELLGLKQRTFFFSKEKPTSAFGQDGHP